MEKIAIPNNKATLAQASVVILVSIVDKLNTEKLSEREFKEKFERECVKRLGCQLHEARSMFKALTDNWRD